MPLYLLILVFIVFAGIALNAFIFKVFGKKISSIEEKFDIPLKKRFYPISRILIPLFLLILLMQGMPIPEEVQPTFRKVFSILLIVSFGWLSIEAVLFGRDFLLTRYDIKVKDNLKARAIHTQMNMLVKIAVIAIVLLVTASSLMVFENVRQLGTSLLASAGVVGVIIGFAAQRSIATLLAGLQLAITQPIRIDDVVIVDNEWGQIEEITLTYVVVRIWDLRRLVVPTDYFLEKTFQNWTKNSSDLLGTVFIYVDYSLPIEVLRNQLYEILKDQELWDGKVWRLHVTNATDKTVELRALMSAANASEAWELRCHVREKLLSFLQEHYPDCLPKIRATVLESPEG
ncbi:mechanosensitive ion channel domain-containing protein [Desulfuromonas sp. AOP6]|uniref:mechanosensitive ion channel family protein n=1 Tax=Desulfuromonas sp. AOP6 TaxID=1566351 RepID=UPI0012794BB9|nr:mechanosensitive ion channel domain-containing protein [Desulfuromonas sp. AOP6]BCA79936.1 hypothetical protein AOP6_1723 [Desulfuromonas sp. AOP6]